MTDFVINTNEVIKKTAVKAESFYNILPENHPLLTTVSEEWNFEVPQTNANTLASTLTDTALKYKAYGLAAIQCGFPYRVFVMGAEDEYVAMFNPVLIGSSIETSHLDEGCLSFPGLYLKITRPRMVEVEYKDFQGEIHRKTFDGMTARIFQHELDHLNGVVYTSKSKPLSLSMAMKRRSKSKQRYYNVISRN